ncbi:Bromodomain containing protein [Histomonas meleagridis]|uniref:Bromodomain containing protein n=1 Tax=Histomonas meleagridis TaxID=135588 RepID=UPI00355AB39D|nr:Bromodomain containing protein [Histomonas meleagridis]KAH0796464.1 Bromodomain containing protein [Histomonas meleagridis]
MDSFTRVELEFCKEVTEKLFKHPLAIAFLRPVNPQVDDAPNYFQKIQHPMDLGTIKANLDNNVYANSTAWSKDIRLVWDNAKLYNDKKTLIHQAADKLKNKCDKMLKVIPKTEPELWSLRVAKINQKLKAFLSEPPPEESILPRKKELALKQ